MNFKSVAGSLALMALKKGSPIVHIPSLGIYVVDQERLDAGWHKSHYVRYNDYLQAKYPEYYEWSQRQATEM